MPHFAKILGNRVIEVIVAEQDFIDTLEGEWVQTSYNTRGNVHYDQGDPPEPDGGVALRGNFAGTNMIYDRVNDVFYEPQPFPSWTLNTETWQWEAPVPLPDDAGRNPLQEEMNVYLWDERNQQWVLQT